MARIAQSVRIGPPAGPGGSDRSTIGSTGRERLADAERGSADGEQDASRGDPAQRAHLELSASQLQELRRLQHRDQKVRRHEQAHQNVGGRYAGAASYTYETGPDRRRYAVGGEVPIDVSQAQDPQETLVKMQVVKRAALAPAEPSTQDRRIAATAELRAGEAQAELLQQRLDARQAARGRQAYAASGSAADGDGTRAASAGDRLVAQA